MKHLIALSFLSIASILHAQIGVFSEALDRAKAVDTARYEVTYSLDYTCHPDADIRFEDVRTVLIGRHTVKDYSDIIHHFDSLCTADMRRGAEAFSNPPDSPWPYEILLSAHGRKAAMKYRLPLGCGVLNYSEEVPEMKWNFMADTTKTILGYDCLLATTEFAGRKYTAWFAQDVPIPCGPYKFGGLPGLILQLQDDRKQFVWEATALEKSQRPICTYEYKNEKHCSPEEAERTISRCFMTPMAFQLAAIGGGKGRIVIVGKDGRNRDATEVEDTPIPYIPIEIK